MFGVFVAVVLTVEVVVLVVLGLVVPGLSAVLLAPVVPITLGAAFLLRSRLVGVARGVRRLYGWHRLSPEAITGHRPRIPDDPDPEALSRAIVERAEEIRRALAEVPAGSPPDEVRVEMCALGYRACVNDMITLTHLTNTQLPSAGPLTRAKLRRARKNATNALAGAKDALPPGALRTSRQEHQ